MGFPLQLNQEQYEALVAMAKKGAQTEDERRALDTFLRNEIEKPNDIKRYTLLVQWQEMGQPLPPTPPGKAWVFPESWPPSMRARIDLISRPIARADVEALVLARAKQPINVLVTSDPAGVLGWTEIGKHFIT